MKINKKILAGVLALTVAAFGFADDFDDWDDFGSDTGSDFGGFSSEPAVTIGGVVELNGRGMLKFLILFIMVQVEKLSLRTVLLLEN